MKDDAAVQARTIADPRPFRSLLGVAVTALLLLLLTAGAKGFQDLETAKERELELRQRISKTRERILELKGQVERLQKDPGTLESLARERMWMAKPTDVVIVLPPATAPAAH